MGTRMVATSTTALLKTRPPYSSASSSTETPVISSSSTSLRMRTVYRKVNGCTTKATASSTTALLKTRPLCSRTSTSTTTNSCIQELQQARLVFKNFNKHDYELHSRPSTSTTGAAAMAEAD